MLKEKIEQLKQLLSEMENPSPLEYQRIMETFNVYKDTYNPNIETPKCTHEQLVYFLARKFINWDLVKLLRNESKNEDIKHALGDYMFGLFYELVSAIKKYDPEGWIAGGFDITPKEMHILKEHRNTKFHVPDDAVKFLDRHQKFMSLALSKRFSEIVDKNGTAVTEYMLVQGGKYPEIRQEMETALMPSNAPNFLWDNYKPNNV
ncbi:MAG TPA: hypothetical protein VMU88_10950 [bacterium]|nr:hypothetical protein [bacterium]